MRPPEPLGPQHQLEGFDCGNAALNRWLQQRALANERQGVSRTVVVCPDEGNCVIAYACLSAGAIVLAEVPGALRRNMPDPLPVWCWVGWRWTVAIKAWASVAPWWPMRCGAAWPLGAWLAPEPCSCTRSMSKRLRFTARWDFVPRRSAPRR
jgi:hypothetical protein